jgi:hypothetical protein
VVRKRRDFSGPALFLFLIALTLHPDLFRIGIPVDERATQNLPDRVYNIQCLFKGTLPLWNPYLFFGSPHIAAHQSGFFYPPNMILFSLFSPMTGLKISTMLHSFLAAFFMFLYLKGRKITNYGAAAGGLVFMMSGYLLAHESHTANRDSVVWIPLLFYFVDGFLIRGRRTSFIGGAMTIAIMVFSGYMHTVVISFFLVGFYTLGFFLLCPGRRAFRKIVGIVFMIGIGLGLSAVQIITTYGILDQTERQDLSYAIFCSGFILFSGIPLFFFPFFLGAPYPRSMPLYNCRSYYFHELMAWIGVLPLVLAGWGFGVLCRGRRRFIVWTWLLIGTISLLLSFGPLIPFYRLCYYIPGYNMFKGPAKNLLGFHLSVSVLSGLGIHVLVLGMKRRPGIFKRIVKGIFITMLVTGLLMIGFIAALHFFDINKWPNTAPSDTSAYYRWTLPSIWIPLVSVGLSLLVLVILNIFKKPWILVFFTLPLLAESLFIKHNLYIKTVNLENIFINPEKNAVFSFLSKREPDLNAFRIYPVRRKVGDGIEEIFYPCINEVYGIRSLSGYGPLFQKDFAAFLSIHSTGISGVLDPLIRGNRVLSLLNVKYLLVFPHRDDLRNLMGMIEDLSTSSTLAQPMYRGVFSSKRGVKVYENLNVLPQAYSVSRLLFPEELREFLHEPARIFNWMSDDKTVFNPREEALMMEQIPEEFPRIFSPARVAPRKFGPNGFEVDVEAGGDSFVVFSELFYPGWHAKLDGRKVKLYRVNAILCGVPVPPGKHHLSLYYLPGSFVIGMATSLSFFVLLAVLGFFWKDPPDLSKKVCKIHHKT